MKLKAKLWIIWKILVGRAVVFRSMEVNDRNLYPLPCVMINCKIIQEAIDEPVSHNRRKQWKLKSI
jgi:hypothetical protein